MTPEEAANVIDQFRTFVGNLLQDPSMSTVFTISFDMLKSLCLKEINPENFGNELDMMEIQRRESLKQDPMRYGPMRRLIYALSESINITARVLVSKNYVLPSDGISVDVHVKQELDLDDIAGGSTLAPTGQVRDGEASGLNVNQLDGKVKEEPEDDYKFDSFFKNDGPKLEQVGLDGVNGYANDEYAQMNGSGLIDYDSLPSTSNQQPVLLVCPLCTVNGPRKGHVKRTASNMRTHLRTFHGKTVLSAKLRLECVCGYTTQNMDYVVSHGRLCAHGSFSMLRDGDEETFAAVNTLRCHHLRTTFRLPVPAGASRRDSERFVCPFCKIACQRTLSSLELHIKRHHRRTCKEAGLSFACYCGFVSRVPREVYKHHDICENSSFIMRHPTDK